MLDYVAEQADGCPAAAIVEALALPKQTVHRIVTQLRMAGLLIREPGSHRIQLGAHLTRFAADALMHGHASRERHAILSALVDDIGETCNLSMLRKGEVFYLDRVEADWHLRLHLPVGTTLPPHCSASGKLLLAFMPAEERRRMVAALPLPRFTDRTITDRQLLASELDRIHANGYAVDNEEYAVGVACVAVPVRDASGEVVAAVAVHAATARLPLARAIEFVPQLNDAAGRISATFA